MKVFHLVLLCAFVSSSAFAAKFKKIDQMTNTKLRAVETAAFGIFQDDQIYGDASGVSTMRYEKATSEKLLNSMKQFNIKYYSMVPSNGETTSTATYANAGQMINYMMDDDHGGTIEDYLDDEQKVTYKADMKELGGALKAMLASGAKLKIFNAQHSDEDGTWWVLNIVDTENQEILTLQRGANGT